MRTRMMGGVLMASILVVGPTATAGELAAGPLARVGATDRLVCLAVNAGSKAIAEIVLEIISSGVTLATTTAPDVLPGEELRIQETNASGFVRGFCRVTIKGSKRAVRGVLSVEDGNGFQTAVVPLQ